jgi:hypothetical protein
MEETKVCYVCGKKIRNLKSIIKSYGRTYCSLKCLNKEIFKQDFERR